MTSRDDVILKVSRDGEVYTYNVSRSRIDAIRRARKQRSKPRILKDTKLPEKRVVIEGNGFGLRHLSERSLSSN